ncbi:MAG: FAD-dependent oxidoreductase [Chryseobacterium sp.]|nr:MAG: FAD-dependent oxidoreductase [Chryseobacterium sp.]
MKRDGFNKSLWQTIPGPKFKPSANHDHYDVIIAGGGITGVSLAYRLQKHGKKCLLLEAREIGFGTTGGTTAHINNYFDAEYQDVISDFGEDKARLLAEVGPDVLDFIRENISDNDIECEFDIRPAYEFSTDEKQNKQLDDFYSATEKVGIPISWVDSMPFPLPFIRIVRIEGQGQFHPLKYVSALAEAFVKAGGEILTHSRVESVEEKDEAVIVKTANSVFTADNFVWATHLPPGINRMDFFNAPYRSYAIAVKLKSGEYPKAQAADMAEFYYYYRSQEIDGEQYLIVGGEDHKTGHETDTQQCFANLEAHVRQYFDVDKVAYMWSSQYYQPNDELPFIGKMPGDKNIYVATGFYGNGITFGSASALVISDLILAGESKYEELFDPSRIKPVAGFTETVKENADVVFKFIKDKITADKLESLKELKNGEGRVVKFDGENIAAYRDENGTLHALNSTCTHVGCTVNWNDTERSWDCPCHGARYDLDGNVLTGPAVKGLERL